MSPSQDTGGRPRAPTGTAVEVEIASGLPPATVSTDQLFARAARLIPPDPLEPPTAVAGVDPEDAATMGGFVEGRFRAGGYAMVVDARDLAAWDAQSPQMLASLVAWLKQPESALAVVPSGVTLTSWYADRTRAGAAPRAVTVVGSAIAWAELVALQHAGAYVARLPLADAKAAQAWVARERRRWRLDTQVRRRAWIVAPADDLFTRRLADHALPTACGVLGGLGFAGDLQQPPHDDEEVGLIVLLTHGADPSGAPVIDEANRARVLRACGSGAIVLHLGCHGAGRMAGDRYGDLPLLVGGARLASPPGDAIATFATDCIAAGASALIGHLDATWSRTLEPAPVLADVLERLAGGTATAACAARMFADEAHRRAQRAITLRAAGDVRGAGESWLRSLDLGGFVCVGDACAHARWADG